MISLNQKNKRFCSEQCDLERIQPALLYACSWGCSQRRRKCRFSEAARKEWSLSSVGEKWRFWSKNTNPTSKKSPSTRMIYQGLAKVVAETGRKRLRSMIPFLVQEFAVEMEEDDVDQEGNGLLGGEEVEAMAMLVEEAIVYSCLASLLFTIVWYRIVPNQSINTMWWWM